MSAPQAMTLRAGDGHELAAQHFSPPGEPRGAVLIVPAMGVRQSFYAPLAQWLAAQGLAVLTFDYRGIGQSRRGSLRGLRADLMTWAGLDCAAALAQARELAPGRPLAWIGHSLGAQLLPFVPGHAQVDRVVTIAAGSGYWRENAPRLRRGVWWLWYVAAPLALRLCGYFPGRRLRKIGDLPHGVMEQWRRWCLDPDYAVGAEGEPARRAFASVRTPITALSFTDDEFMSARSTTSLLGFYCNAPKREVRVAPADAGLARIGHFGFFAADRAASLWQPHLLPALAA